MDDSSAGPPRRLVNVNTASLESLRDDVSGIGPVLAERIVAYREAHGPFAAVADLVQIEGIGPVSLARFADQLTVSEGELAEAAAPIEPIPPIEPESIEVGGLTPSQRLIADPVMTLTGEEMALRPDEPDFETAGLDAESIEQGPWREKTEPPSRETRQTDVEAGQPGLALEREEEQPPMQAEPEPQMEPEAQPEPEAPQEPEPQRAAPPPIAAEPMPAAPQRVATKSSFWHSFLLVLLGGLAGVVLTLLVILLVSGTLDFASRSEVDALSRNMGAMQANNELAWQRIEDLSVRAERAERQLAKLDELTAQIQTVEADLGATQSDLAEAKLALNKTAKDLESLQAAMDKALTEGDERLDQSEANVKRLSATVAELQETVSALDARVQRFDAFFGALRDLLIDLEGAPVAPTTAPAVETEPATPTPLPSSTPLPTLAPTPTATPEAKG